MRTPGFLVTSVLQNPYLAVSVRARLRRRPILLMGIAWVALIVLCIELNYFLYSSPNYHLYPSLQHCFFSIFFQLLAIQLFLALFPTAYYCSNSVSLERSARSLPLLRATPLSGYAITFGKIASDPARIWFLLALGFPFTVVCAAIGRVNIGTLVGGYALMFAGAFFACSLGLLCSTLGRRLTRPGQAGGASMGLIVVMLFVSQGMYSSAPLNALAALSPIPFIVRSITQRFPFPLPVDVNLNLNFMGVGVHPFFISFPVYVLLGAGCLIGAARRVDDDNVPVLSRTQTVCAYILYQLAICGMIINFFRSVRSFTGRELVVSATGSEPMLAYSLFVVAGIVLAAFLLTPTRSRVANAVRKGMTKTGLTQRYLFGDAAPPFPLLGGLFLIALCGYALFSRMVLTSAFSPLSRSLIAAGAGMLFFCIVIFSMLVQSCYLARGTQAVIKAGAVLVLYFVVPAVISSLVQLFSQESVRTNYIYALNPIHALTRSFSGEPSSNATFLMLGTGVYTLMIIVLSFAMISQIRGLRRHIDKMRRL